MNSNVSRRSFCAGACTAATAAALSAVFSACSGGSSSSSSSPSGPSSTPTDLAALTGVFANSTVQVNKANSPLAAAGGAALVNSIAGAFLVARTSANGFTAVEAVCTHEACTITGQDGSVYVCPCHGSRYNRNGQVILGPATASLRQHTATFDNGVVSIAF